MYKLGCFLHRSGRFAGIVLTGALCSAAILPAAAASYPSTVPEGMSPQLKIHASRYYALAPARVTVYGRLRGVDSADTRFCHPGETWITGVADRGSQLSTISRHDPRCIHQAADSLVNTTFMKDYSFSQPGSYTCRLVVSTNDGRIVQSNLITITVR